MKNLIAFLTFGSIALNLALLAVLVAGRSAIPASTPAPAKEAATARAPAGPTIDDQTWASLKNDDLPAMVARLRASGFPPEIVRAIMAARLRESYAARMKALDPGAENRPFWKSYSIDPSVQLAQRKLYREEQEALRKLLGADYDAQENLLALNQGRRFDSVPPEKLDDVRRLLREFDDKRADIYGLGGMIGAEQQRKVAALEKETHNALAQILTPRELEDYDLRNSDTARMVRYNLSAFNPSEDEFRTIYKLQAQFDAQFGRNYGMLSPDEQARRNTAQQQLNDQIKAALSPTRAAEYEQASDFAYRQTGLLVSRLGLPPETTTQLSNVKKDFETRSATLRRDTSLTPADRSQQLAVLNQEASAKITTLLGGPRGFDAYRENAGYWLQPPRPATPPPATPAR